MERALRRFYVAVSSPELKLQTVLELLNALQQDQQHAGHQAPSAGVAQAAAICCSSRDSLDAVVAALLDAPDLFSVFALHSDLSDKERELQVSMLRKAMLSRSEARSTPEDRGRDVASLRQQQQQLAQDHSAADSSAERCSTVVLVTTDVCLRALPKELLPLGVPLLVQYDLALHKETYHKRVSAVCGSGKERRNAAGLCIVIDFVAASEVAAFRASESWFAGAIREMPVHVAEVFQAA